MARKKKDGRFINYYIDCITNKLQLTMSSLKTENIDRIAICTIDFAVHSLSELQSAMESIAKIEGIDEVLHVPLA